MTGHSWRLMVAMGKGSCNQAKRTLQATCGCALRAADLPICCMQSTPSNARLHPTCSPSIVLVVCPQSGHILWQNSASCSAMGIIAAEVALPVAGSCEPCNMNYLQQVFWGNDVSAGQCCGCNAASVLVDDWKELQQVAIMSLWSKIMACCIGWVGLALP